MTFVLVFFAGVLTGSVTAILCVGLCAAGRREDEFLDTLDDIAALPEVEA